MILLRCNVALLALSLGSSCAGPPPPEAPDPPRAEPAGTLAEGPVAPATTGTEPALAEASALSCKTMLPPIPPPPRDVGPVSVGQMSEEAAQAKRLFDREQWPQAIQALERVASGETGDDDGNRQLAEYHRAVALAKAGQKRESADAFLSIALRPNHTKHPETALWIAKLAEEQPQVVLGLETFDEKIVQRFDNPQQRETHDALSFLLGRQRFEHGDKAEAAELFRRVPAGSRFHRLAQECAALAGQ